VREIVTDGRPRTQWGRLQSCGRPRTRNDDRLGHLPRRMSLCDAIYIRGSSVRLHWPPPDSVCGNALLGPNLRNLSQSCRRIAEPTRSYDRGGVSRPGMRLVRRARRAGPMALMGHPLTSQDPRRVGDADPDPLSQLPGRNAVSPGRISDLKNHGSRISPDHAAFARSCSATRRPRDWFASADSPGRAPAFRLRSSPAQPTERRPVVRPGIGPSGF